MAVPLPKMVTDVNGDRDSNRMQSLDASDLARFPRLTSLDISYQSLRSVVGSFTAAVPLVELDLSHNRIRSCGECVCCACLRRAGVLLVKDSGPAVPHGRGSSVLPPTAPRAWVNPSSLHCSVVCADGLQALAGSLRTLTLSHNLVSRIGRADVGALRGTAGTHTTPQCHQRWG